MQARRLYDHFCYFRIISHKKPQQRCVYSKTIKYCLGHEIWLIVRHFEAPCICNGFCCRCHLFSKQYAMGKLLAPNNNSNNNNEDVFNRVECMQCFWPHTYTHRTHCTVILTIYTNNGNVHIPTSNFQQRYMRPTMDNFVKLSWRCLHVLLLFDYYYASAIIQHCFMKRQ